jgi:hypothetical protein
VPNTAESRYARPYDVVAGFKSGEVEAPRMQCHYCDREGAVAVEKDLVKVGLCEDHFHAGLLGCVRDLFLHLQGRVGGEDHFFQRIHIFQRLLGPYDQGTVFRRRLKLLLYSHLLFLLFASLLGTPFEPFYQRGAVAGIFLHGQRPHRVDLS